MDEIVGKKIKKLALTKIKLVLFSSIGCFPLFLLTFCLFFVVFFVLGVFDSQAGVGVGGSLSSTQECGFTISKTSLSQTEYKDRLIQYSKVNSNFKIFADNADGIYKYAHAKSINPELVAIRAKVENNGNMTGSYNYWGLNCTNEGQGSDCYQYSSFEEGYTNFIDIISKYDSLASMMSKYAYIGKYWYTLDTAYPSSDGGCYYAPYIYSDNMPDRVKKACATGAPSCVMNGDTSGCAATSDDDQKAYANWQVKKNMAGARKEIFGLEYEDGPCTTSHSSSHLQGLSSYNLGHNNLNVLSNPLSSSEVRDLNSYINKEVDKAGYGTGDGVAAAGQALTYWLEQKGVYLQYRWGGGHGDNFVGVNSNWGSSSFGCDYKGRCYNGMDCSGFVSWAIRTACTPSYGSTTTHYMNHGPAISIDAVKPGDLMLNVTSHVRLVVKNNGDGTVIVAEETGGAGGLVFNKYSTDASYDFIDMSGYYSQICSKSR